MTLLLAGCGVTVPRDELVVLTEAPAVSPDPRFALSAYDFKLAHLMYAALVSVDNARVEPQMDLASAVTSKDGLRWEVALRDAQFSDGRPVTADDVAYTVATVRDPATGSRLRQRFVDNGLTAVDVVDAKHLVFTLDHPHAPFLTDLDFGVIERPSDGKTLPRGELPVGAGPYVFDSRDGEIWRLKRNRHYFAGMPPTEHLTIKTIRDDNTRLLALVGGSGDLTQNTISPLVLDAVAANPRLSVETAKSSVYSYLGLNCDDPILRDPRVRRALALGIDKERIVRTKLRGRAVLATGMLPTFHWAYAEVPSPGYDPVEARRLLDEAGFPKPADGPRFTLVYKTSNNRFRVAIAGVIAVMLAEIGVEVDVRVYEFATFFADVKKGNFQMFSMQIPEIAEPDLYTNFFGSKQIPTRENLDAGGNRMHFRSPPLDALLQAGRREPDQNKRKAIYADVQRLLAKELPVISLWHEDNVVAHRKEVVGFELLPTGQLTSLARTKKE